MKSDYTILESITDFDFQARRFPKTRKIPAEPAKELHRGGLVREPKSPARRASEPLSLMATHENNNPNVKYQPLLRTTMPTWIATCNNGHRGHSLQSREHSDHVDGCPLWLYDLKDECLVAAKPWDQYAALSYVWGQVSMVNTTKSNISDFQESGGLRT